MRRGSSGFAWFILAAIATAVAVPSASFADGILLSATSEVTAAGGTSIFNAAGTVTGDGCNVTLSFCGGQGSSATAAYVDGYGYAVSGTGGTPGGTGIPDSSGLATVTDYFKVECAGPCPIPLPITVPLIFSGAVETGASRGGTSGLSQGIALFGTPAGEIDACTVAVGTLVATCNGYPRNNSGELDYAATAGEVYKIGVEVNGFAQSLDGGGTWFADADPEVVIDPTFPEAADYTIVFSPELPTSTVPEPSSSLLLVTGLLALTGAVRYKNLATLPASAVHQKTHLRSHRV
jgi:hypothetical protein